jgi:hypothetical protein
MVVLKYIISLLLICFFIGLICSIYIEIYYWLSLPLSLDAASARVHEITIVHGSVRYGTEQELANLRLTRTLFVISTVPGFIAGVLAAIYKPFS